MTRETKPFKVTRHSFNMNHDFLARRTEDDGLEATRESMRRDLNRANTAVGIILLVVLALAVAAVIAGLRSQIGRAHV